MPALRGLAESTAAQVPYMPVRSTNIAKQILLLFGGQLVEWKKLNLLHVCYFNAAWQYNRATYMGETNMKTPLLAITLALSFSSAGAESIIYKCVKDGKTLYSESPCRPHAYQENRLDINTDLVGTVDPDRETIEAARARIRAGMATPGATSTTTTTTVTRRTRSSSSEREETCNRIKRNIQNIESSQRQRNSGSWQDHLTQRKRDEQQRYDQLGC